MQCFVKARFNALSYIFYQKQFAFPSMQHWLYLGETNLIGTAFWTKGQEVDSDLRPSILTKVHIMILARYPTYDTPRGMSHKKNNPCHGLILVLIVGTFWQMFYQLSVWQNSITD